MAYVEGSKLERSDLVKLERYVYYGIQLPKTKQDYEHSLGIDSSMSVKVDQHVDRIMIVYEDIRCHCQTFESNFYPKDLELVNSLYHHARKVKDRYECFYDKLAVLAGTDPSSNDEEKSSARQFVDIIVADELSFFEDMEQKTNKLIELLHFFKNETTEDEFQVRMAMQKLDLDTKPLSSSQSTVTFDGHVKKLKLLSREHSKEGEPLFFMALVGYLPRVFLDSSEISPIIRFMKNFLSSPDKDEATKMAIVSQQIHFMWGSLEEITTMIQDALKNMRRLQGYFQAIQSDLEDLNKEVKGVSEDRRPLELREAKKKSVLRAWDDLCISANHYRQHRFEPPQLG